MNTYPLTRGIGALLLAQLGTFAFAQEPDSTTGSERRVRIEITRNENGKTSHVTKEFDLNNDAELHDALRELGVIDELGSIGDGENVVLDLRRTCEGGALNDMSLALSMPAIVSMMDDEDRAYLGVQYLDVGSTEIKGNNKPTVKQGALITHVEANTPASAAGLKDGDVIVQIDKTAITSGDGLAEAISAHEPDDEVKLVYYRGKQKKDVKVKLGRRESGMENFNFDFDFPDMDTFQLDLDGADFGWNMPSGQRAFLGIIGGSTADGEQGVRIGEVVEGSAAERMGLQEGDVIQRINDRELDNFGELAEQVGGMEPEEEVRIDFQRNGSAMSANGTLGSQQGPAMPPMPPLPMRPDVRRFHQDFGGMGEEDREEMRRDMEEMRRDMEELRRELRSDVTRKMRVTIDASDISAEDAGLLKKKGVTGLDSPLDLSELHCTRQGTGFHLVFEVPQRADLNVDLHNAQGERVYHETISGFKGHYDRVLDLEDQAAGTYFLVITQNGKTRTKKLVKN